MGSVCGNQQKIFRKIEEYIHPDNVNFNFKRADANHSRFGNIEKIRTKKSDIYKLIMATNDVKLQTVSIQCRIMQSVAEFELYDGTKFELQDKLISPLIDMFNSTMNQIYHPIKTLNRNNLILKSYSFTGYSDNVLKKAVYQIWLYNELRSMSPLIDHFIMSRSKTNVIVMIFKNSEASLLEIARYRQLADYHWTEAEVVTLWKMLINNYKYLNNLSICHRDIRLGKIFYTSENKNQPFQFVNLETSRKVTRSEANDLLTVVGVNIFAQSPMKQRIDNEEELATYDPLSYDTACLIRVLLSLLNLDPLEGQSSQCKNQRLTPIIGKLRSDSPNFDEVQKDLDIILRSLTFDKSDLFKEDKIISEHLSKSELRRKNREKIDIAYFHALLQLHKKDIFNRLLIEKIDENDSLNKKFDNIALLHQVGQYYANIGLQKNQYYEQQFRLLLDLTQQCRQEEFFTDHQEYLNQLSQLLQLIPKEKQELSIRYYNQLIYKFINQGKIDTANQYLSNLLDQSYRYNDMHINNQIDILITKSELEIINGKHETAENTLEKISCIVANDNFDSQYDAKRYQAQVQYLKAYLEVQVMKFNHQEIKKKRVAVSEASLETALTIFTNLPESTENTLKIINTYLIRSDLAILRQSYPESKKSLESSDILINQLQKNRSVSDSLKIKLLQRLKTTYEKSNKANEPYYKEILNRLGKIKKRFELSNSSRHQISKEIKAKERQRSKQERMVTNQQPIQELDEEDES